MNNSPLLAISTRLRSTPFTHLVKQQGAKAFTVYNHMLLPTEFISLEEDYWHLCEHVQVWDVGAERQVSVKGPDAQKLIQWMTPRDISKVDVGRCLYVPLADENGMLINDPVALKIAENHWWLSVADSDVVLWAKGLATGAGLDVLVCEPHVWPVAVQGPKSDLLMTRVFGEAVMDIKFFRFKPLEFEGHEFFVARSGWSKQGGYEVYVDDAQVGLALYDALFSAGSDLNVRPGCPNLIERIEGGLLSFGNDMTAEHTVLESGLDRFFDLSKTSGSMSTAALLQQRDTGIERELKGIALPSDSGEKPFAVDLQTNHLIGPGGERLGWLGSQAWSPRYNLQLATVVLEKPHMQNLELEVSLNDGSSATANVLKLPFDFDSAVMKKIQLETSESHV